MYVAFGYDHSLTYFDGYTNVGTSGLHHAACLLRLRLASSKRRTGVGAQRVFAPSPKSWIRQAHCTAHPALEIYTSIAAVCRREGGGGGGGGGGGRVAGEGWGERGGVCGSGGGGGGEGC